MPKSEITKRSFADAFKVLLSERTIEKISVSDICEYAGMTRKSFYYHFHDKYDLPVWIFETEFIRGAEKANYTDVWLLLIDLCEYLYRNRTFYAKAFAIKGQNSFAEYFKERLSPAAAYHLKRVLTDCEVTAFHVDFFADAYMCAVARWLFDQNPLPPEDFIANLKSCSKGFINQ